MHIHVRRYPWVYPEHLHGEGATKAADINIPRYAVVDGATVHRLIAYTIIALIKISRLFDVPTEECRAQVDVVRI